MRLGIAEVVVCLLLLQHAAAQKLLEKDHSEEVDNVLRVVQSSSHLPLIGLRRDLPHFHTETLRSLLEDNDKPCGEARDERYRRSDGVCNNLRHPFQGASMDTERRLFPHTFLDGSGLPRIFSKDGHHLPSARTVSLKCFGVEEDGQGEGSKVASQLVWQFGQFISHDMTLIERFKDTQNCCDNFTREHPYESLYNGDEDCFPIEIPEDDPYFTQSCMTFARAFHIDLFGVWELVNGLTSYIDASVVYGPNEHRTRLLRTGVQGLLRTQYLAGKEQLPYFDDFPCLKTPHVPHCPGSGDPRMSDHPGLLSMHSLFHIEHNRIARKLFNLNRHWGDERLFQESRKIVTAIFQKMVWEDYLPLVLGPDVMQRFRLNGPYVYDETVDAGAILEFTGAALRFGHSMINTKIQDVDIAKLYFRQTPPENTTTVPFFMAHNHALKADKDFTTMIRERMYEGVNLNAFNAFPGPSFDLPALNIQRGRDFGLPTYATTRDICLDLMHGIEGVFNTTPACLKEGVYSHEEDVDLFVGGMTETPLPNAIMGPTFACLTAIQFQRLRFGDRFFYEKQGPEGFHDPEQLAFIRRSTMANLICELDPKGHIQRDAFRVVSHTNPLVPCSTILAERFLDHGLSHWKSTVDDFKTHSTRFADQPSCD